MFDFDEFMEGCLEEQPIYFKLKTYYHKPPDEYIYTISAEWSNTIEGHYILCDYTKPDYHCNKVIVGTYPGATEGWFLIDQYKAKKLFKTHGKK